jgi:hypothetical protein
MSNHISTSPSSLDEDEYKDDDDDDDDDDNKNGYPSDEDSPFSPLSFPVLFARSLSLPYLLFPPPFGKSYELVVRNINNGQTMVLSKGGRGMERGVVGN